MPGAAEEEVSGSFGACDARKLRGLFGGVAVPVRLGGHDRLLVAHVLTLRLRAVLLGGAFECLVDSAHHLSPLPSQRRKARPRSSTPGVASPAVSPAPPSSSRSTSRSCRTCSARPTPVCARLDSSDTPAPAAQSSERPAALKIRAASARSSPGWRP